MHLTTSPVDWYAARAGGVVAYVVLSAVVVLGVTLAGKRKLKIWPRFAVEDVHRFGGLLVGAFVAIHVLTIAIDAYLPFSIASLTVPLASRYRPLWVGLGVAAAELLLALAVANHYRNRLLSYAAWRRTHYLTFAVWIAATLHDVGAGTDRSSWWLLAITTAGVVAVVGATTLRLLRFRPPRLAVLRIAPNLSSLAAGAFVLALALGPLHTHHRRRTAELAAFTERLHGRIQQNLGPTRGIVSVAGTGSGRQPVLLRADLLIDTQGLLATTFQMEYLPSGRLCTGRVTRVHSTAFEARCRMPAGANRAVTASWTPVEESNSFADGVIQVHAA